MSGTPGFFFKATISVGFHICGDAQCHDKNFPRRSELILGDGLYQDFFCQPLSETQPVVANGEYHLTLVIVGDDVDLFPFS